MKIHINKSLVGLRIKKIRLEKGYTLEEFGKLFNANKALVSKWTNGSSLPNIERIKAIAKLGDMSVNELLYGSVKEFVKENYKLIGGVGNYLIEKNSVTTFIEFFNTFLKDNPHKSEDYNINNIDSLLENLGALTQLFLYDTIYKDAQKEASNILSTIPDNEFTPTEKYNNKEELADYIADIVLEKVSKTVHDIYYARSKQYAENFDELTKKLQELEKINKDTNDKE